MSKQRNITVENHKFMWVVGKDHMVWIRPHKEDNSNPLTKPVQCNVGFYPPTGEKISISPAMVARWITENIFKKEWTGSHATPIFLERAKKANKFIIYEIVYEKPDYYTVMTGCRVIGVFTSREKANTVKNTYDSKNTKPEFVSENYVDYMKIEYIIKEEEIIFE